MLNPSKNARIGIKCRQYEPLEYQQYLSFSKSWARKSTNQNIRNACKWATQIPITYFYVYFYLWLGRQGSINTLSMVWTRRVYVYFVYGLDGKDLCILYLWFGRQGSMYTLYMYWTARRPRRGYCLKCNFYWSIKQKSMDSDSIELLVKSSHIHASVMDCVINFFVSL